MTQEALEFNVEKVLYGKNPGLKNVIPRFVVRYLKRIIHQDEINNLLKVKGHLKDYAFNETALEMMGIKYHTFGNENLPSTGRYIFVSNHPLGGLDGMVF